MRFLHILTTEHEFAKRISLRKWSVFQQAPTWSKEVWFFVKLLALWCVRGGEHIYMTNWGLQLLYLPALLWQLLWEITAVLCNLSLVRTLAIVAGTNLACKCADVCMDAIMLCIFVVLNDHFFPHVDVKRLSLAQSSREITSLVADTCIHPCFNFKCQPRLPAREKGKMVMYRSFRPLQIVYSALPPGQNFQTTGV